MDSGTFQDQVKKLEGILKRFKDILPIDNGKEKGENYHCFGPFDWHSQQDRINETIGSMKTSHQLFSTINNPTDVLKCVTEKQALTSGNQPLKECLQQIKTKMRQLTNDNSLKVTMQKLEAISLEEGLHFDREQLESNCFISSDMFYIEVALDQSGVAEDVKLHGHTGEAKSCKELITILRNKDYKEFHAHLKGLKQRYLVKGDTFTKSKILNSLEIVEEDIVKIMKSDISSGIVSECIMSGPVGHITPRVGGKGLQMTFCADPLKLLDTRQPGMNKVFTNEDALARDFGCSVCLSIQQSLPSQLPTVSVVSTENNMLNYINYDGTNSENLPAKFVLNFSTPFPASIFTAKCLYKTLNRDAQFFHDSKASLDDLIFEKNFNKKRVDWLEVEYPIILPDELHLYRCLPSHEGENPGILLSNIPFSHPMQLAGVIKILRCQAIYNILLCSCFVMDVNQHNDGGNVKDKYVFDVKASEENIITVTFIHPIDDSISSIDFEVTCDAVVECSLNVIPGSPIICTNDYLNKIVNRCLSLPIAMRSAMRKAKTYRPEYASKAMSKPSTLQPKPFQKPLKLVMPTLAQMHSNHPLISPQLTSSPSAFLNFSSASGISPSTPIFPTTTPSVDGVPKHRKRTNSNTPGTPSNDGSRTPSKLKLPKITLKRKRTEASDIYEIDKTKSHIEATESVVSNVVSEPSNDSLDSLSFVYSQFENDVPMKSSQGMFSDSEPFPGLPSLEGESDIGKLLGIPSEPFMQESGSSGNSQVAAFDIDAIRSDGDMNFDASAIDPSALVTTPTSFDIDASGMIDIDSFM